MGKEVNVAAQSSRVVRPRGWWSRHWKWFVPAAVVGLLLACGAIGFAILARYNRGEPYQKALAKVQADPRVLAKLGQPIDAVFLPPPGGIVRVENDRGDANLTFEVKGPKGKGIVHTQAQRIAGKWGLSLLEINLPGGEHLKIDVSADSGMEEAPPWPGPPAATGKKAESGSAPKAEGKTTEPAGARAGEKSEKKADEPGAPNIEFQVPPP